MNLLPDGQQFKYKRDPKIVIGNWKLKTQNKQIYFFESVCLKKVLPKSELKEMLVTCFLSDSVKNT